jgi:hypothetical protein
MHMQHPSYEQAKVSGLRYFYAELCYAHPELQGQRLVSRGRGAECIECNREYVRNWRNANREYVRQADRARGQEERRKGYIKTNNRKRYLADRKSRIERQIVWQKENSIRYRARLHAWRMLNVEQHRENARKWYRENRDAARVTREQYRARLANAVPLGASFAEYQSSVRLYYKIASRLTQETGIRHSVDHIAPLDPCRCCGARGLHEPGNLQVLRASANSAKGNRCQACWQQGR